MASIKFYQTDSGRITLDFGVNKDFISEGSNVSIQLNTNKDGGGNIYIYNGSRFVCGPIEMAKLVDVSGNSFLTTEDLKAYIKSFSGGGSLGGAIPGENEPEFLYGNRSIFVPEPESAFQEGTIYYLNPDTGNDTNDGLTPQTAKRTSSNGLGGIALQPGDVVELNGYEFPGRVSINASGSDERPILIRSSATTPGKFTGLQRLSNFTPVSGRVGLWQTNLVYDGKIEVVDINGEVQRMGQLPKINNEYDPGFVKYTNYVIINSETNIHSFVSSALPKVTNPEGASVVIVKNQFELDPCEVRSVSGDTWTIYSESDTGGNDNYGVFLRGHIECCTEHGEWSFDKTNSKFYIFSNVDPNTLVIKAKTTEYLALIGRRNLKFENIEFEGGDFSLQYGSQNIRFVNCKSSKSERAFTCYQADKIEWKNCDFRNNVDSAIYGAVLSNSLVTNCSFKGLTIAGAGSFGTDGYTGVIMRGLGNTVQYSTIQDYGYIGLRGDVGMFHAKNVTVRDCCNLKSDGGGIYLRAGGADTLMAPSIIENCAVFDIKGNAYGKNLPDSGSPYYIAFGIYLDDNANHVTVNNNFVQGCTEAGIYMHHGHDNNITNNVGYDNKSQMMIAADLDGQAQVRNLVVTGNKWFSKSADQYVMDIRTKFNDVQQFGTFDNNVLGRPFGSQNYIAVSPEFLKPGDQYHFDYLTLAQWKTIYGKDNNSTQLSKATGDASDYFDTLLGL